MKAQPCGTGSIYRIGRVPKTLLPRGDAPEARFGRLDRDDGRICFDKAPLVKVPPLEWVTPGHPLFEVARADLSERAAGDLRQGDVRFDIKRDEPARLDFTRPRFAMASAGCYTLVTLTAASSRSAASGPTSASTTPPRRALHPRVSSGRLVEAFAPIVSRVSGRWRRGGGGAALSSPRSQR